LIRERTQAGLAAARRVGRGVDVTQNSTMMLSRQPRRCWPIRTSRQLKSRNASVSPATLYRCIPRANREYPRNLGRHSIIKAANQSTTVQRLKSTLIGRSGYLRGWSRLDEDFPEVSEVTSLPVYELLGVVIADHRPARAWAIVAARNASFAFL
jgi:hypothetical protein